MIMHYDTKKKKKKKKYPKTIIIVHSEHTVGAYWYLGRLADTS